MSIAHNDYVPVLKWRQGEYQALSRLASAQKDRAVPLIEVCPPEFDFERQRPAKSINDHLCKFGDRLEAKWGSRLALIDASLLDPSARLIGGVHPLTYLLAEARARNGHLVPVTALSRNPAYQTAVRAAHAIDTHGVAVRCSLDDIGTDGFPIDLLTLLSDLGMGIEETDLILDLGAANLEPIDDLADLLAAQLQAAAIYERARSLVVIGTAFPESMSEIGRPAQFVPRREWLLYKALTARLPAHLRTPTFGDYAIATPQLPQGDMRLMKPFATIRYTVEDAWLIAKGFNVRDYGYGQYRAHSKLIVSSPSFLGVGFSEGGDYISRCATGAASTGNLTTWRWVGTNHHITKVVADLASFHGL